jgi:hypothetical protein
MPRKSPLLLISFFLIVAPPLAKANSIILTQLDSGQLVTLVGSDFTGTFVLTPNSIVHLTQGLLHFGFSTPVGWAGGAVTFAFSIGDFNTSGGFPNVSPCPTPNVACFGFGLGGIPNIGQMTPASWTLTFLGTNGGTETAHFFVSDATPEPPTLLLFGTGGVLLGVIYRCRMRSAGGIV